MEQKAEYYDSIYSKDYNVERYSTIYDAVISLLDENDKVLEIGCGLGDLGAKIAEKCQWYNGFDFSQVAVEEAQKYRDTNFFVGDAYDKKNYELAYDTVVAIETFEHLDDIKVLSMIPEGTKVIFSVPTYKDKAHLRTYPSLYYIKKHYADVLKIESYREFDMQNGGKIYLCTATRAKSEVRVQDKISACMIVKDEELVIQDAILSLVEWVDEIVLVDTGSTDKTIEIAKEFGGDKIKLFHYRWNDDFSDARNFSMDKATHDWIFILDADERVVQGNGEVIKGIIGEVDHDIIAVDVLNLYMNKETGMRVPMSRLPSLRFFRREYDPEYTGRVHNKPVVRPGTGVFRVPFTISHLGYDLTPEKMAEKFERTVVMCREMVKDDPENPESYFHLARALKVKDSKLNIEAKDEIFETLEKGISLCSEKNDFQNIYIQLLCFTGWMYHWFEEHKKAVEYGKKALVIKTDYLDAILLVGSAYMYGIDVNEGEKWIKKYLEEQSTYDFSSKIDSISMEHANSRSQAYRMLAQIEDFRASQVLAQSMNV